MSFRFIVLDLSISVSGGKETNQDSPSSGERRGKSPAFLYSCSLRMYVVDLLNLCVYVQTEGRLYKGNHLLMGPVHE